MDISPPPYNPQLPTAPSAEEAALPGSLEIIRQNSASPTGEYSPDFSSYVFDVSPLDDDSPPEYDSIVTSTSVPNFSRVSSSDSSDQEVRPLRCKSGVVCVGVGDCTDIDEIRIWKTQYMEIRDCKIYLSPSKDKRNQQVTISLKDRYISMPGKRLIAVQGGHNSLLVKSTTEVVAHQWFMTLSQYCFVAPMMEGFCDKLSRGKNVFEERFMRLSSDGVLSWYKNDNDDSERRGSIQLRGERCQIDNSNTRIVHVHIEPRGYQFRFHSSREAQLWLAAFQWHYGRRPLRKAAVPLRNKVK